MDVKKSRIYTINKRQPWLQYTWKSRTWISFYGSYSPAIFQNNVKWHPKSRYSVLCYAKKYTCPTFLYHFKTQFAFLTPLKFLYICLVHCNEIRLFLDTLAYCMNFKVKFCCAIMVPIAFNLCHGALRDFNGSNNTQRYSLHVY